MFQKGVALEDREKVGILVVDDDESMRTLIFLLLSRSGYRVILAENGEQAFELFSSESISLVTTDQSMPGMDGFTLAAMVKVASPSTPVIMITGSPIHEGLETSSVDHILYKPFQLDEFNRTVETALHGVGLQPRAEQGVEIHIQG